MQTGQLTTIQAGAFLQPNPNAITCSGSGQGSVDFAAFLLSLLSMESFPLEVELPEGEKPVMTGEGDPMGAPTGTLSPLLATLLSNKGETVPSVADVGHHNPNLADLQDLPAGNAQQSAEPGIKDAAVNREPMLNDALAAALFSLPADDTSATMAAWSPIRQPGKNDPQILTRPIPVGNQDAGLILSGHGIKLPEWEGGPPTGSENIAAIDVSGYTNHGANSQQLPSTNSQSSTVATGQETDIRSNGFTPSPAKAGMLSVPATQVSGSPGEHTGITAENITAIFKDVEVESLKVPANSSETSKPLPAALARPIAASGSTPTISPIVAAMGGEIVEGQQDSALPLPKNSSGISSTRITAQVYVGDAKTSFDSKSLSGQIAVSTNEEVPKSRRKAGILIDKDPAVKSAASKPNQISPAEPKAGSKPVPWSNQVSASGSKTTTENLNKSVAAFDGEPAKGQYSTGSTQAASASSGPNLPGGLKIKPEGLRMNGETDIKSPPTFGHLELNVPVKGKVDLPESPRVQFTVEPESFRQLTKPSAEIRLRLHPDQLGMMRLQLRTVDHHLTARVVVQSAAARLAVEGNLTELQRTMGEAGLVIDRFEVTVGHTTSASTLYPDSDGQKRRYAYKPKANRRYQAAAGVQRTETGQTQPTGVITAPGDRYHLNMVA